MERIIYIILLLAFLSRDGSCLEDGCDYPDDYPKSTFMMLRQFMYDHDNGPEQYKNFFRVLRSSDELSKRNWAISGRYCNFKGFVCQPDEIGYCFDQTMFCFQKKMPFEDLLPLITLHDNYTCKGEAGNTTLYYAWGLFNDPLDYLRESFEKDIKPVQVDAEKLVKDGKVTATFSMRLYSARRFRDSSGNLLLPYGIIHYVYFEIPTLQVVAATPPAPLTVPRNPTEVFKDQ